MDGVLAERARRVAEVRLAPMATRLAHVCGVAAAAERLVERIDPLEVEALCRRHLNFDPLAAGENCPLGWWLVIIP